MAVAERAGRDGAKRGFTLWTLVAIAVGAVAAHIPNGNNDSAAKRVAGVIVAHSFHVQAAVRTAPGGGRCRELAACQTLQI